MADILATIAACGIAWLCVGTALDSEFISAVGGVLVIPSVAHSIWTRKL